MRGALQKLARPNTAKIGLATAVLLVLNAMPAMAARAGSPASGTGAAAHPPAAIPVDTGPAYPGPADTGEDNAVAYAVPRSAPAPDVEIVLPLPLPPSAVAQYRRIMALQTQGAYRQADALIGRLQDPTLLGPILADRYLSAGYIASVAELRSWLAQYGGQPAAPAIYALLRLKSPQAARALPAPGIALLPEMTLTPAGAARPSAVREDPAWRRTFARGLTAWQRGEFSAAGLAFAHAATMARITEDDRAAAAFWAARAMLRLQRPDDYLNWLARAATPADTFYGMLANRLLGADSGAAGGTPMLSEADVTAVDAVPNGHLAFALLQIGATGEAAAALRTLWPEIKADPGFARSVMTVAAHAKLVDVAVAIAGQTGAEDNAIADARLPLPPLRPDGGFTVDPPLVYALARTESGFDAHAVSAAGARGLMQLMPVTARFIAQSQGIAGTAGDPSANLALGQGYLRYLGEQPGIGDNLLAILASYNAGPNAAAGWHGGRQAARDPLLFIETIPNDETRRFVRQVLADSWIYAEEIGLKPRSLDEIMEGDFPRLSGA